MTIYLDVLLILNIYVNFLLLKGTEKFLRRPVKTGRIIAGALIGSLSCLVFLLPQNLGLLSIPIKLIFAMVIVLISFGYGGKKNFLRSVFLFFCINFLFAGMITALELMFHPSIMSVNNGILYLDFSLLTLIAATIAAYASLSIFHPILARKRFKASECTITITYDGKTIVLNALADTGNQLIDYFTGKPIILCKKVNLTKLLPAESFSFENIPKGFRITPVSTVNSSGTAYIFKPDSVFIKEPGGKSRKASAMVGFTEENIMSEEAVLNPNLL